VFNEFQDAMENTEPLCADVVTYSTVRDLFHVFSQIYDDKKTQARAIEELLETLLGRSFQVVVEDGVMPQPCGRWTAYLLIPEIKNKISEGHADPYNQGSLAYRKY